MHCHCHCSASCLCVHWFLFVFDLDLTAVRRFEWNLFPQVFYFCGGFKHCTRYCVHTCMQCMMRLASSRVACPCSVYSQMQILFSRFILIEGMMPWILWHAMLCMYGYWMDPVHTYHTQHSWHFYLGLIQCERKIDFHAIFIHNASVHWVLAQLLYARLASRKRYLWWLASIQFPI